MGTGPGLGPCGLGAMHGLLETELARRTRAWSAEIQTEIF